VWNCQGIHYVLYVILAGTDTAVGMTGFHVGLRCLLLGATLITLERLDEAEKVCVSFVYTSQSHLTCTDLEEDLPM